jgi:hypothetical protein
MATQLQRIIKDIGKFKAVLLQARIELFNKINKKRNLEAEIAQTNMKRGMEIELESHQFTAISEEL